MSEMRRTRRLLAVVAGVLLLAVSAVFLDEAVSSAGLDETYPRIFPADNERDSLVSRGANDLERAEVSVVMAGPDTLVNISLRLPGDSDFTQATPPWCS
jgi:hypothetical protein